MTSREGLRLRRTRGRKGGRQGEACWEGGVTSGGIGGPAPRCIPRVGFQSGKRERERERERDRVKRN